MIKKIKNDHLDGNTLAAEAAGYLSEGRRTNCYFPAADWAALAEGGSVLRMDFPGGCYLFLEKERQFDLFYFLERDAKPASLPPLGKPVLLEQVAAEKAGASPAPEEWEAAGFRRYLQRKRLFLAAKAAVPEEREPCFCREEEQGKIEKILSDSFEPYTSALPDTETLAADLREKRVLAARRDGELLGFLRFGREKKVSVLRQIAVLPAARGRGVAEGLVRGWVALERDNVAKFQLWVREDNPPALRLYEKLGFMPDGRIAPVMIATPRDSVPHPARGIAP